MFQHIASIPRRSNARPVGRAILAYGLMTVAASLAVAQAPAAPPAPAPAATPTAPAGPAPRLVVAEPVRDAGTVSKGERVKVDFVLENQGEATLEISGAHPSCGCTVASFDKTIAPGGKGKIHAELDTADFQGPLAKTITVASNDPVNPRLTLTIKVKVEPHIGVHPGYARYIYVQTLEPGMVAQTLWALDGKDFKVLDVQSPYKFIKTTFHEATEAELRPEIEGRQWRIEMTIQPDAEVGPLREFLMVKTEHPDQAEVRIPISGFVRPLLHVTPQVADFGEVKIDGEPHLVELTLVNFGEDAISIDGVEVATPGVSGTVEATEAGRRFKITVTLGPEVQKGALETKIKIRTSSSAQPIYEVPIKGKIS